MTTIIANMDNNGNGDFIVRLIKEVSGLEGEIIDYKITLSTSPAINLKKLLSLKHTKIRD